MLVRRILEISFFGFYWICVGLIALKFVYHKWLVQQLKIQKLIGDWVSCAVFILILFIIYLVLRHCMLSLYAKCKLSEKRVIANMKKECRSLESGINSNAEAENSFESLLSETTIVANQNTAKQPFGKSMENISTEKKLPPIVKEVKSLENIFRPKTPIMLTSIRYEGTNTSSSKNAKNKNPIYNDLSESLKHVILKHSKSLGNTTAAGNDDVDASVSDLMKIYENFYELQNTMQRNKRPIRKAPPVPAHMKSKSHDSALATRFYQTQTHPI